MITMSPSVNGTVYCMKDFLTDQVVVGVRSTERQGEVLSIDRVAAKAFYYASDIDALVKKILDDALMAHSVYWNSRLWC